MRIRPSPFYILDYFSGFFLIVTVCWILQGVVRHGTKFCFLEFDYNICLICYEIMSIWIFVYLTSQTLFERISPNIDETVIVNRKYMEQLFYSVTYNRRNLEVYFKARSSDTSFWIPLQFPIFQIHECTYVIKWITFSN